MNLNDLKKELPYKWRVQSTKFGKTTCVAYIDARDCMDILDEVCGSSNWQSIFYQENGLLFCKVGIFCVNIGGTNKENGVDYTSNGWVWKSDTGSESKVEKDKGHVSDAFKRACVKWGIGRFLYRLPIQTLTTKQWKGKDYPYAPEKDKIIFDGDTLTKYINWKIKNNK